MKKTYQKPQTECLYIKQIKHLMANSMSINSSDAVDADQAASRQAVNIWDDSSNDE